MRLTLWHFSACIRMVYDTSQLVLYQRYTILPRSPLDHLESDGQHASPGEL